MLQSILPPPHFLRHFRQFGGSPQMSIVVGRSMLWIVDPIRLRHVESAVISNVAAAGVSHHLALREMAQRVFALRRPHLVVTR